MMGRVRDSLIVFAALLALAVPVILGAAIADLSAPEQALASPSQVIRDCAQDGRLDHHYSQGDLRGAEQNLPTDVNEYTDCRDVINQAQVSSSGHKATAASHGGGGGGGSDHRGGGSGGASSARDVKALDHATKRAGSGDAPSLSVNGQRVEPGSAGVFNAAGAANDLPIPVLLALLSVAALAAGAGYLVIRRRLPEVRSAALRIFRR